MSKIKHLKTILLTTEIRTNRLLLQALFMKKHYYTCHYSDVRPIDAASILTSNDTNKRRSNNKGKRTAKKIKLGKSN
ncbi:hypothetical protein BCV72DRAFT_300477 [Rhizopus microsporus var. microsporus]|uniref:Uncharacterized protein n=1 Tax=Rhizopus microsporus var. microsporus TaxID=86635 RepID=A0A1X0RJD8_RHIZD|nr:hypothetical protein BCV72DRAFT_300477 [Rhizopus microsporus var. microsporus]